MESDASEPQRRMQSTSDRLLNLIKGSPITLARGNDPDAQEQSRVRCGCASASVPMKNTTDPRLCITEGAVRCSRLSQEGSFCELKESHGVPSASNERIMVHGFSDFILSFSAGGVKAGLVDSKSQSEIWRKHADCIVT